MLPGEAINFDLRDSKPDEVEGILKKSGGEKSLRSEVVSSSYFNNIIT